MLLKVIRKKKKIGPVIAVLEDVLFILPDYSIHFLDIDECFSYCYITCIK